MTRWLGAAGFVALLILTAVGSGATALAAGPESQATGATERVPQTTPDGFDSTVFHITVYENGSARWTLRYVRLLENDSQVATFRDFAETFENSDPQFVRDFRTRATRLTAFGTNATGREMNATRFRSGAFVEFPPGGTHARGVVELSFLWTNFARASGDRVVVSDVFDGGMYIDTNQRLVFSHGPNLAFAAVDPSADSVGGETLAVSETVTWIGERRFLDARPRIAYEPAAQATDSTPGTDANSTESDPGGEQASDTDDSSGLMLPLTFAFLTLLGLAVLVRYRDVLSRETTEPASDAQTASSTVDSGTEGTADEGGPAVSEEELLSDEDRVVKLLEENGGRMKQVDIVDETEWSKSKVSMVLSDMEEAGEISKLRVGRENIISLSGHEPDAAGSPFDED